MIELIPTADGSHSLFNSELNETYHSRHGAIRESQHVFINNGLIFVMNQSDRQPIKIMEVGFGTGLNALLVVKEVLQTGRMVEYTTVEAFPISEKLVTQFNYPQHISVPSSAHWFLQLHTVVWDKPIALLPNFVFHKKKGKIQEMNFDDDHYDIIFFDAFAPDKQPEMWEMPVFKKIYASMKVGGILVTYCAKGQLKRDLRSVGLEVESLPGPPGKREMVRACKH
jgi:tRNA U34 5-methylaminomethyl-2-thiouridine-forming methyltransferase MnmC